MFGTNSVMAWSTIAATAFLIAAALMSLRFVRAAGEGGLATTLRYAPIVVMWTLFGAMSTHVFELRHQQEVAQGSIATSGAMAIVPGATLNRGGREWTIVGDQPCPARTLAVSNHPIGEYAEKGSACVSLGGPLVMLRIEDPAGSTHLESFTVIRLGAKVWLQDHQDQIVFNGSLRGGLQDPSAMVGAILDQMAALAAAEAAASASAAASAAGARPQSSMAPPKPDQPDRPLRDDPNVKEPVSDSPSKV